MWIGFDAKCTVTMIDFQKDTVCPEQSDAVLLIRAAAYAA